MKMHPQDIKAGQGAVQLMQNALQNQAHAQDKATQAFDRLSENAFNFAKYFENKQRYQEEKALREQAYNDEKAYREQRDKINDERYTQEFNENKRRYDNDYAIKKQVANAQTNLYGEQATGQRYANLQNKAQNSAEILALRENVAQNSNTTVGKATALSAIDSSIEGYGGDKHLKEAKELAKKQGLDDDKINKINMGTNINTNYTSRMAQK